MKKQNNKNNKEESKNIFENLKNKFNSLDLQKLGINFIIATFLLWGIMFLIRGDLPSWLGDKLFFVLFIASGVFYFVQKIKAEARGQGTESTTVYYFSHLFLLSLLVIAVNQFLKRAWIIDNLFYISVLSIGFGFLTFYANRDRVEKEIESEKVSEEKAEKKRAGEFEKKFPRIARIWGVRGIVRWMYKEGWWYSVGLIAIVVLGGYFYFNGLSNYGFQGDEYYHAKVAQTYFESGKLFSLGDIQYTRSQITSMLPIISKGVFNFLKINATEEFIFRFFIPLFGIGIIILTFFISKYFLNKKTSLIIAALIASEIFFIYFAKYLRFYTPTLFFTLLILFLLIKFKTNLIILIFNLIFSLFLFFYLNSTFILIMATTLWIIIKKIKNKKLIYLLSFIGLLFIAIQFLFLSKHNSYVNVSSLFMFNFLNISKYFSWLMMHWGIVIIIFISGLVSKNNRRNMLYLFSLLSFLFFSIYLNNTFLNFTFRTAYFFLPIVIICFTISAKKIFNKKFVSILLLLMMVFSLYEAFNYNIKDAGDYYHPTKKIYEKTNIIIGTKDISKYLNSLENEDRLILVGGGGIRYYLDNITRIYGPSQLSPHEVSLNDFKGFTETNSCYNTTIVFIENSIPKLENKLYFLFWNNKYSLEAPAEIFNYVSGENKFKEVFNSKDNVSKIYRISC